MVTDFQDRLRQMRESKTRESDERRAADSLADLERYSRVEARLARREQLEKVIEEYGAKFIDEVPAFQRKKSFFEGKYKIEFSNEDLRIAGDGSVDKYFSRITFLLDLQPGSDQVHIQCKKTAMNRDLESSSVSVHVSGPETETLQSFAEEQFFQFADAYFSASPDVRKPVAP